MADSSFRLGESYLGDEDTLGGPYTPSGQLPRTYRKPSVYVAFGADALMEEPGDLWVDVTTDVQRLSTYRGGGIGPDRYQPGTATIILKDRNRDYDRTYPASTFGPYVRSLLQVKVEAPDSAGVIQPIIRGHVIPKGGWQRNYATDPALASITVRIEEPLALLARVHIVELTTAAYGNDTTGERLDRICDAVPLPTSWRSLDTGTLELPATTYGDWALELAQKIMETEGGRLYCSRAGVLIFEDRHGPIRLTRRAVTNAIFGPGDVHYDRKSKQRGRPDEYRNKVTIKRDGGVAQVRTNLYDADGASRFETMTFDAAVFASDITLVEQAYTLTDLEMENDHEAAALADWDLHRWSAQNETWTEITLSPRRTDDELDQALQRELGDRVTVNDWPGRGGRPDELNSISDDVFWASVRHEIDNNDWRCIVGCASTEAFADDDWSTVARFDATAFDACGFAF